MGSKLISFRPISKLTLCLFGLTNNHATKIKYNSLPFFAGLFFFLHVSDRIRFTDRDMCTAFALFGNKKLTIYVVVERSREWVIYGPNFSIIYGHSLVSAHWNEGCARLHDRNNPIYSMWARSIHYLHYLRLCEVPQAFLIYSIQQIFAKRAWDISINCEIPP